MGLPGVAVWCGLTALAAATDAPAPVPPGLQSVIFRGQGFLVRSVDPRKEDLRLFLNDDQGQSLRDFVGLDKYVSAKGGKLVFAANAGMFDPKSKPVGLLVQNGTEQSPLNLEDGAGNFFMKPNGVFVVNEKCEARVMESSAYTAILSPAIWATQSGPLLVNCGEIHPDFNPDSKSKKVRSGVGIAKDGTVVFVLSRDGVTFYDFASLFLEKMNCPNALYLDGDISAFYAPGSRDTIAHSFGPMFGIVERL
jgi:uncharacterized protein YigE (DUF2233 family)